MNQEELLHTFTLWLSEPFGNLSLFLIFAAERKSVNTEFLPFCSAQFAEFPHYIDMDDSIQPKPDAGERFSRHLAAHQRRIYAFVYAMVQNRHAADDVMQEVSSVLWRRFGEFQEETSFSAWAYKVARLQVLTWRRKQERLAIRLGEDELHALMDTAAVLAEQQDERIDALEHCLAKLSPIQRELLRSRYHFGLSVVELAEQRNRARRTVYKALGKIHNILLDCIRSTMEDASYGKG